VRPGVTSPAGGRAHLRKATHGDVIVPVPEQGLHPERLARARRRGGSPSLRHRRAPESDGRHRETHRRRTTKSAGKPSSHITVHLRSRTQVQLLLHSFPCLLGST
jgi:hypothetical protein